MHESLQPGAFKAPAKQPETQAKEAGAHKTQRLGQWLHDTMSNGDGELNPPQSKQTRLSESFRP